MEGLCCKNFCQVEKINISEGENVNFCSDFFGEKLRHGLFGVWKNARIGNPEPVIH